MRWIVGLVSTVVLLAGVTLGLIVLVPTERIATLATAEFTRMTGRALTIEGSVRASVWPVLGVRMDGVRVANAGWSTEGPLLAADELAVSVDLASLFGGDLRITGLQAQGLTLILERAEDGVVNWAFGTDTPPDGAGATTATPFTLDRAELADGRILFIDHGTGQRIDVASIDAKMAVPAYDGPVTVTATASLGDQPVVLSASADSFAAALAGRVVDAEVALQAGGSSVDFKGRLGVSPPAAEGDLQMGLSDLRAIAALTGTAVPDLPEGLGRSTRNLTGKVTLAPEGTLHLRQGVVTLDGNSLTIAADTTFDGPRPRISAQIDAGALVVPGLGGAQSGDGPASPQDAAWSRDPIDVSPLALVDAEVAFRADSLALGPARMGRTRLMATLDRARAAVEVREMQVYGGNVGGQFVVNGRGGLSVGGDLTLAGMQMQPLLTDLAGYDRLIGAGDLHVKFLGVGNSLAAIMASLKGDGKLALGKGELRGFDLLGMLRTLDPGFVGEGQKTIFDGVSGSFTIAAGVLSNDDLALKAPYVSATGKGTVGLGAQVIDYRLVPTALTQADGTGGVRVPLQITGPWSAPRFALDLKALADQELAEERAKLEAMAKEAEARAKAELEARAAEELGVVRQEGESLEDAAKRRAAEALEEETQRVLQNLLGD